MGAATKPSHRLKADPKTTFNAQDFLDSAGVARKVQEFTKKEKIFVQGGPCENVFYVQKGGVRLSVVNESGKEAVVAVLGPGDFFGEGCLAGQPIRIGTATAITASTILIIEKKEMVRVLHAEHAFSDRFISYNGIANPPIEKVDKNVRKPSEYFKSNIYVDCMGPSAICLRAMTETCGVDRVLFGSDFGPVPMSPKLHIDLVNDTISDAADREKIFSVNALALLRLQNAATPLLAGAQAASAGVR
jgi:hypothetical protein